MCTCANNGKVHMKRAIELSAERMRANLGGPFGAVIVKDDKIIAEGFNQVTSTNDSTGVDYLDRTALKYRIFKDIWAARTLLLRQEALPPLKNAAAYDFAEASLTDGKVP